MEEKTPRQLAEIIERAMSQLNEAVIRQQSFSDVTRRRTNHLIWFGMGALFLLGFAMFFLTHILTKDTRSITVHVVAISGYIEKVNENLSALSNNVHKVNLTVKEMREYMATMPTMTDYMSTLPTIDHSINNMNGSILTMSQDIAAVNTHINTMSADINQLNHQMANLNVQLTTINHQFNGLNNQLGAVGYNVNQIASPMRFFPFTQ